MKQTFKVTGMHCPSCAMIIKNEMEETNIIDNVRCDYQKGTLVIDSKKDFAEKELNKKFEKLKYTFEKV